MREILQEISSNALSLGEIPFTDEQLKNYWLGFAPADSSEIKNAERRLNIELPNDYKSFLAISNGFAKFSIVAPSFMSIENINYLKSFDPFLVEIWQQNKELVDIGTCLESSILIGGLNEEQLFLLIPPYANSGKWGYWKFANWIPGEERYNNLQEYLSQELDFLKKCIKDG